MAVVARGLLTQAPMPATSPALLSPLPVRGTLVCKPGFPHPAGYPSRQGGPFPQCKGTRNLMAVRLGRGPRPQISRILQPDGCPARQGGPALKAYYQRTEIRQGSVTHTSGCANASSQCWAALTSSAVRTSLCNGVPPCVYASASGRVALTHCAVSASTCNRVPPLCVCECEWQGRSDSLRSESLHL